MSTEQLIAPACVAPDARRVIRAASGSSRYRSLIGCWISLRVIGPRSADVVISSDNRAPGVRPATRPRPCLGAPTDMTNLASGTVTLLFTDIEGSTRLLRELGDGYEQVLADQRRLLREAFDARNGNEVDTAGDGFFY